METGASLRRGCRGGGEEASWCSSGAGRGSPALPAAPRQPRGALDARAGGRKSLVPCPVGCPQPGPRDVASSVTAPHTARRAGRVRAAGTVLQPDGRMDGRRTAAGGKPRTVTRNVPELHNSPSVAVQHREVSGQGEGERTSPTLRELHSPAFCTIVPCRRGRELHGNANARRAAMRAAAGASSAGTGTELKRRRWCWESSALRPSLSDHGKGSSC